MVSDVCGIIRKSGFGIQVAMKVAVTSNGVVVYHALLVLLVVAPALEVLGLSVLVGVGNRLWPGK